MLYENFLYPQIEEAFLYLKHIFISFYIAFWSSYLILSNISPWLILKSLKKQPMVIWAPKRPKIMEKS